MGIKTFFTTVSTVLAATNVSDAAVEQYNTGKTDNSPEPVEVQAERNQVWEAATVQADLMNSFGQSNPIDTDPLEPYKKQMQHQMELNKSFKQLWRKHFKENDDALEFDIMMRLDEPVENMKIAFEQYEKDLLNNHPDSWGRFQESYEQSLNEMKNAREYIQQEYPLEIVGNNKDQAKYEALKFQIDQDRTASGAGMPISMQQAQQPASPAMPKMGAEADRGIV
jgi:hypothetical protein